MVLNVSDEAKHYLASIGYSPTYGARPLNRAIQSELLNPLSVLILENAVRDGEIINIQYDGPHNRLVIVPNHERQGQPVSMDVDWDDDDIEIEEMD
jgi:ATP-dependent Clp protease ATP-binding subunit ClpA